MLFFFLTIAASLKSPFSNAYWETNDEQQTVTIRVIRKQGSLLTQSCFLTWQDLNSFQKAADIYVYVCHLTQQKYFFPKQATLRLCNLQHVNKCLLYLSSESVRDSEVGRQNVGIHVKMKRGGSNISTISQVFLYIISYNPQVSASRIVSPFYR